MKKTNQTTLNITANLMSFAVTFIINFFMTPYITKNVGMEAYGLVGLANSFTNYITIVTSALNSMVSRFVILEIHKNNYDEANKYYNSAIVANTVFAVIIMIGSIFFIPNLHKIINVSPALVQDAKLTFLLVFISFSFSLVTSVLGMSYYAKNKLNVGAWRCVKAEVIRAVVLVLIFNYIGVKIYYTIIAILISSLYTNALAVVFTKKELPEIRFNPGLFDLKKIIILIKSGLWNAISKLGQVILNGLDLLITNLFIGGSVLGCVSIAKTFANIIITVIASVSDSFLPKFLKAYAKDSEELNKEFFKSTKILGFFSCVILSVFAIYCEDFYRIWLPGEDSILIRNITLISLISISVSGPIYSMFSLYTVINKIKPQAIATLIMSVASTITVFILLKLTDLGVYAIVGVSTIYSSIKNLTYNIFYLRKYMNLNIKKCYGIIIANFVTLLFMIVLGNYIKQIFVVRNFFDLFMGIFATFVINSILYFVLLTNKEDKKLMISVLLKK